MDVSTLLAVGQDEEVGAVDDLLDQALQVRPDGRWSLEPVAYVSGSPATASLHRLRGHDRSGRPWSLFCKVLQHVRHWPVLAQLPPPMAAQFVEQFPWRAELALWDPRVQACLPTDVGPGSGSLRSPRLHRVVELADDRAAVWMEDVVEHSTSWNRVPAQPDPALVDLTPYETAAHLLGRWNARATADEVLAVGGLSAGHALRMYAERSVPLRGLAPLSDDGLWAHPWLAPAGDLRDRLRRAGDRVPGLLDRLDTHRQALPHGDASPQNLLVPADAPDGFVAIDVSFTSPHALGFDLGQLLVGLTHAGLVPAAALSRIAAAIVPAYRAGLAAEGLHATDADVRWAFATATLLRSGLDAVPYEVVGSQAPGAEHLVQERLALSRFLLDQHERVDQPRGRS